MWAVRRADLQVFVRASFCKQLESRFFIKSRNNLCNVSIHETNASLVRFVSSTHALSHWIFLITPFNTAKRVAVFDAGPHQPE